MSWIKSDHLLPPVTKLVKLKWIDGTTAWSGYPTEELKDLKPEFHGTLLWWDEAGSTSPIAVMLDGRTLRLVNAKDIVYATDVKELLNALTDISRCRECHGQAQTELDDFKRKYPNL